MSVKKMDFFNNPPVPYKKTAKITRKTIAIISTLFYGNFPNFIGKFQKMSTQISAQKKGNHQFNNKTKKATSFLSRLLPDRCTVISQFYY